MSLKPVTLPCEKKHGRICEAHQKLLDLVPNVIEAPEDLYPFFDALGITSYKRLWARMTMNYVPKKKYRLHPEAIELGLKYLNESIELWNVEVEADIKGTLNFEPQVCFQGSFPAIEGVQKAKPATASVTFGPMTFHFEFGANFDFYTRPPKGQGRNYVPPLYKTVSADNVRKACMSWDMPRDLRNVKGRCPQ